MHLLAATMRRRPYRSGIMAPANPAATKDSSVTPAELRSIRDALGLPIDRLAQAMGVTPRTVRAWESGRHGTHVPTDVATAMYTAYTAQADYVRARVHELAADPPERLTLLRYRTDEDLRAHEPDLPLSAAAHGIAQQHIAAEVHYRTAIPTRVVWAQLHDYHQWEPTRPGATLQAWADTLPWDEGPADR